MLRGLLVPTEGAARVAGFDQEYKELETDAR
jgi:hypothetical protein